MPSPLSVTSQVKWSTDQLAATVDREVVILSVERGAYYGLDEIGSEIWQLLENPISVAAVCNVLAGKYDADHATIERDVLALFQRLVDEGLVTIAT